MLIARHEPVLGGTTNVAGSLSKFAARKRKAKIDGIEYDDWFASDFTLAEIKELRARERVASRNKRFDNAFEIPTFQDVIDLAKKESARTGRTIGIYPETKHPTWHQEQNLPLERKLVDTLVAAGWTRKTDPVVIQSFEVANLKQLRGMTSVPPRAVAVVLRQRSEDRQLHLYAERRRQRAVGFHQERRPPHPMPI